MAYDPPEPGLAPPYTYTCPLTAPTASAHMPVFKVATRIIGEHSAGTPNHRYLIELQNASLHPLQFYALPYDAVIWYRPCQVYPGMVEVAFHPGEKTRSSADAVTAFWIDQYDNYRRSARINMELGRGRYETALLLATQANVAASTPAVSN